MQPLISPPRHQFGPCLPAPRLFVLHLFVPCLPRCCRSLPLLLSPRLPRCGCPATAAFGYRSATRTATLPAWSEMPPRTASLLQFCPEHHHPEAPHGPQPLPLGLKCRHGPRPFCSSARSTTTPKRRTACACSPALPGAPTRPALLLLFCPGRPQSAPRPPPILPGDTARAPFAVLPGAPVPALPGAQKRRTEPHRGPPAAKKQPICRGSITAAALQPVRSVHAPETDPFRIVRAGISG